MDLLLCPILLSNPPQKSKTEMYFPSCLVLHLRCCFPLEALCVVGRQAFPPLSYILYPRFLAALADRSPKSSSSIWDAPIPADTEWAPKPRHTKESILGLLFPPVSSSTTVYVPYQLELSTAQTHMQTYPTESLCQHHLSLWKQCTSYSPDTGGFVRKLKAQGRSSMEKN